MTERHVLGLSGGRDSAALAVYMRQFHPEIEMEYFFTDTGKELPEVYEFLGKLEGVLGTPIVRLNPDRDFDFWLKRYKNFLPSVRTRWCTKMLKIRPFEAWVKPMLAEGAKVFSYVAIRADENYREGYTSTYDGLEVRLPFKGAGVGKAEVSQILDGCGLGLPKYYEWRSRSGCTFCFFQQKIEWVRLMERHPDRFREAQAYEKTALKNGSPFTWSQGESLEELALPVRIDEIRADHQKRLEKRLKMVRVNPLRPDVLDPEDIDGPSKSCLVCHK